MFDMVVPPPPRREGAAIFVDVGWIPGGGNGKESVGYCPSSALCPRRVVGDGCPSLLSLNPSGPLSRLKPALPNNLTGLGGVLTPELLRSAGFEFLARPARPVLVGSRPHCVLAPGGCLSIVLGQRFDSATAWVKQLPMVIECLSSKSTGVGVDLRGLTGSRS